MDNYKTEIIQRCAEMNGPCWECKEQKECLMWEEELNGLGFCKANESRKGNA